MKKISFLICALLSGTCLLAQNWTGAVSSDWNNPANWSAAPGNGDDIQVDPANYTGAMANPVIAANSSFTPAEMLVQNGAHLTISAILNASDRVEIIGEGTTVTINAGGTFALNGGGNNARLIFVEDAHLQMEGGNLNVGQRLLFEIGATGEVNGGNITVGETIALVDGSLLGSSKLVQNGGTITTNGEFGFENEAGEYFPAFEQTAGTLQVNGALVWLGAAPGSGRGYLRSNGGTIRVTGSIGNDPSSTMGMSIVLSGNALLENAGNTVDALEGDSIVLVGGAEWRDMNACTWQNNGIFHAEGGSLFTSGNTTLNGVGAYQFAQLTIPALKLLNHAMPAFVSVSGNMEVFGMFSHNNNKLVLNGSLPQSLTASGTGFNLYDLEIANEAEAAAVVLSSNANIAHQLLLTDGIVSVLPAATIKLADNATATVGSDTTFVDGYIEKTGNDAFQFPLGTSPGRYRPLSVSAPATASTIIRAAYKFSPYTNLTPAEMPLLSVSNIEYWDVSRTGSADLVSATIGWNDAAQSGISNCGDISMTVWNGTQWTFVPSTTTGLCDGNNAGTLHSSAQLPTIGPLTIAFTQNVTQNPVQLCAGESITVGMNTYNESGVYMDVLEDVNGDDSTVVTILTVDDPLVITVTNNTTHLVATTNATATYQWIDCNNQFAVIAGETGATFNPAENGSYAVIVTQNGCSDTSACTIINQLAIEENALENTVLYPNPVEQNGTLTVTLASEVETYEICTTDGRTVKTGSPASASGKLTITLPELAPGTYLLKLNASEDHSVVKRFLVK